MQTFAKALEIQFNELILHSDILLYICNIVIFRVLSSKNFGIKN